MQIKIIEFVLLYYAVNWFTACGDLKEAPNMCKFDAFLWHKTPFNFSFCSFVNNKEGGESEIIIIKHF